MKRKTKAFLWLIGSLGAAYATKKLVRDSREIQYKDKVVLITGGSRGLGLVMARQLAEAGARLALCARDAQELERAAQELFETGADVLTVPCDVTDPQQINEMIGKVRERFGTIDVLINNAGVIQVGPLETMSRQEYEEAMNTHFWGPYHTTQALLPLLRQKGEGRIVNVASIGGKVAIPHLAPYSASKFALVGFSEGLRAELMKSGILVTTACPGLIRTGSPRNATIKGDHQKEYAWFSIADSIPGLSLSAEATARAILEAARKGEAEVVTSVPAKILTGLHGWFPGLATDLMALTNRLLPKPGTLKNTTAQKGYESQSWVSPSPVTQLTEKAAAQNNEM
ncbi:Short-chain dehydrogenase [Catalinimonas alkaloidigena]|uniref:Short-chain dehydrogenase n=1 Tax=Catalinimonas alkaloidigena TaxID=1075417 RepID=A0A1G9BP20_9BACT|nr:SDR family NAD(P)-dependent oxidoreductase [Catalinimonas alkaloidigena]SDK41010.1 Short-chain dehydrogenase [Catalinimonas alkaloidigena]